MASFKSRLSVNCCCGIAILLYAAVLIISVTPALQSHLGKPSQKRWKSLEREYHGSNNNNISNAHRDPKLFGFISFVALPATTCLTDGGTLGACMTGSRCTRQNGTSSGTCTGNFGVCCIINLKGLPNGNAATVSQNGTDLIPSTMFQEQSRYEIPRKDGVCQIRLDFVTFDIDRADIWRLGPDAQTFGDCSTDTFTVSGAANGIVGPLCGDLKGQHMYLDYGTSDKINLDIFTPAEQSQKWDIFVTMICNDSIDRAPPGCFQYYTAPTGMVKSFNYNNLVQLNNEDYTVCIRAQVGMRKITWKSCMTNPATTTDFIISGGPPALNPAAGNVVGIPVSGDSCNLDWVMILGQNKYCGSQFPDSVVSTSQPFILQVHFNDFELPAPPPYNVPPPYACPGVPDPPVPGAPEPDALNTGFCLKYSQSPF